MMSSYKKYFDANRKIWDAKTPLHIGSRFYNMEGFLAGENSLRKIELSELPDVTGKSIFHSQCHFGQDTISLARMGASNCTGIDLSPEAIAEAKRLRDRLDVNAVFKVCNVYDIDQHVVDKFDLVFTSYGVIGWLPDLMEWARQLAGRLRVGGVFYMAEFHPVLYMYDWVADEVRYSYFNTGEAHEEMVQGSYADREADIELPEYFWQHSLSEVVNALIANGIRIDRLNEYDYSPYDCFENLTQRDVQEYVFKGRNGFPHVFTITGVKV